MPIPTNPSIAIYLQDDPSDPEESKAIDRKILRAKEISIFQEETKLWQRLLTACNRREGEDSLVKCKHLAEIIKERNLYGNNGYENEFLPTRTPGLPAYAQTPPFPPIRDMPKGPADLKDRRD